MDQSINDQAVSFIQSVREKQRATDMDLLPGSRLNDEEIAFLTEGLEALSRSAVFNSNSLVAELELMMKRFGKLCLNLDVRIPKDLRLAVAAELLREYKKNLEGHAAASTPKGYKQWIAITLYHGDKYAGIRSDPRYSHMLASHIRSALIGNAVNPEPMLKPR